MPAMSPTMTEGNIASWKVKEGAALPYRQPLADMQASRLMPGMSFSKLKLTRHKWTLRLKTVAFLPKF
jgi:hypothetical protein